MKSNGVFREIHCNRCDSIIKMSSEVIETAECLMYDEKHLFVTYLKCPTCGLGYPYLYDDAISVKDTKNTFRSRVNRETYRNRYLGKPYQSADPDRQLEFYAPGR